MGAGQIGLFEESKKDAAAVVDSAELESLTVDPFAALRGVELKPCPAEREKPVGTIHPALRAVLEADAEALQEAIHFLEPAERARFGRLRVSMLESEPEQGRSLGLAPGGPLPLPPPAARAFEPDDPARVASLAAALARAKDHIRELRTRIVRADSVAYIWVTVPHPDDLGGAIRRACGDTIRRILGADGDASLRTALAELEEARRTAGEQR